MKIKLISIIVSVFALINLWGADIKLQWNPSTSLGVTNYVVYASTNVLTSSNLYDRAARLNVGTNLTATIQNIRTGSWWFTVTAMSNGLESDCSNIINVNVPVAPQNLRTIVIQYDGTLSNFYDVGFFKLRTP